MGLAFAAFLPLHLALTRYRSELWPTVHLNGLQASQVPDDAHQVGLGMIMNDGRRIGDLACFDSESSAKLARCLDKESARGLFADVHPASHYWPIQLVETGIVLALAAIAVRVAFRVLRRRTAP